MVCAVTFLVESVQGRVQARADGRRVFEWVGVPAGLLRIRTFASVMLRRRIGFHCYSGHDQTQLLSAAAIPEVIMFCVRI